ncbi:MAG: BatA domain-containing protein, partial [Planctomycetota bacterium]|nr:BatA domain-containing protein [Planctomycetota bacterium]
MSSLYPTLLTVWLPVLIGVPVLIHLINLMRHRKVRWAAMNFLLESQKKNQNWVRFKEILLLLTRMAAMGAIVVMLAGPLASLDWSRLFAGGVVHHVLLVDDSLSMSDQWNNTTALKNARGVVEHLLDRTVHHQGTHLVTL